MIAPLVLALTLATQSLAPEVEVPAGPDAGQLRCEPSVAIHDKRILVSWNDSYGGSHGSQTGVAIGWAMSEDGGKSFRFGGYMAPDDLPSGADSRLAADDEGNFYLAFLQWKPGAHKLHVYRMDHTSFGTWKHLPVPDETNGSPRIDKPALVVAKNGFLGLAYDRGSVIHVTFSKDAGKTWSKPLAVSNTTAGLRNGAAIGAHGERVYVAWNEGAGMKMNSTWVASSQNGGSSFSAPQKVHTFSEPLPDPKGFAIAPGDFTLTGSDVGLAVYEKEVDLVYNEGHEGIPRRGLMRLRDGERWEAIHSMLGLWFPAVAATDKGTYILEYWRSEWTTGITNVVLSLPPGNWRSIKLNDRSTDWTEVKADAEKAPFQRNFGDYISLAAHKEKLVAAWTAGKDGRPRIFCRVIKI